MKSVAYRMNKARTDMIVAVNRSMAANELPAYIMESILGEVLGEVRKSAASELLGEIEREKDGDNMEQGVQSDKLAE